MHVPALPCELRGLSRAHFDADDQHHSSCHPINWGRGFAWLLLARKRQDPDHNPTAPLPDTHQNPYRSQGQSRAHQTHHQASPDRQMRHGGRAAGGRGRICRSGEAWWWVWWARLRPWLLYGSWWVSGRGAVGLWSGFSAFFGPTVTMQTPAPKSEPNIPKAFGINEKTLRSIFSCFSLNVFCLPSSSKGRWPLTHLTASCRSCGPVTAATKRMVIIVPPKTTLNNNSTPLGTPVGNAQIAPRRPHGTP